jgi:hypothetical protein
LQSIDLFLSPVKLGWECEHIRYVALPRHERFLGRVDVCLRVEPLLSARLSVGSCASLDNGLAPLKIGYKTTAALVARLHRLGQQSVDHRR